LWRDSIALQCVARVLSMLIIGARLIVSSARLVPCARLRISTDLHDKILP
jgi:hypothetical protein